MSLTILSPPATEPVSLSDAKAHLRVTHTAEDDLIARLLTAARERIEAELGLAMVATGFSEEGAVGDHGLPLSRGPAPTISSVSRADASGGWIGLASTTWRLCGDGSPARVLTLAPCARLRVEYQAGYGGADDVPAALKQAVLALMAEAYAARDADPPAASSLQAAEPWTAPFRRPRL